jgi:hypothetical protein
MLKNTDVNDLNAAEECIKEAMLLLEENISSATEKNNNKRVILDCLTALAFINLEWHEWVEADSYFNKAFNVSFQLILLTFFRLPKPWARKSLQTCACATRECRRPRQQSKRLRQHSGEAPTKMKI